LFCRDPASKQAGKELYHFILSMRSHAYTQEKTKKGILFRIKIKLKLSYGITEIAGPVNRMSG